MIFDPALHSLSCDQPGYWFCFRNDQILVHPEGKGARIPFAAARHELGVQCENVLVIGSLEGVPCYAASLAPTSSPPQGVRLFGLRELFNLIDDELFWIAGRAAQLLRWERINRFCGGCGKPTHPAPDEHAMICGECDLKVFPTVAPAIIVAVVKEDSILLARAHRFPPDLYSVIAGFVEPGETLEQCVVREVREETGITVGGIRYFGSQSWPFPNSLMIAFTAEYAGGEIHRGEDEIADAGWFSRENMPAIPSRISVARKLIDWFLSTRS
jgi:NAD+ diphosphatase